MSPAPAALALLPAVALPLFFLPALHTLRPPSRRDIIRRGSVQMHLLPEALAKERGAQCLDHTPAGYYIRKQDPLKWLIWLESGGQCSEPADCIARSHTHRGSSTFWDASATPTDRFISPLNPFAEFSHVWVPYCSGDIWLGASPDGHTSLNGLQMSGHLILETLVGHLLNTTRLGSATDVVFGGHSAGGLGVYYHADWLADILVAHARALEQPPPRVVGLPISGMFYPMGLPVTFAQFSVGDTRPWKSQVAKTLAPLADPWLPPACVEAQQRKGLSGELCLDISALLPYVQTPLFITQNRFDSRIIRKLSACPTCVFDSKPGSAPGKFIRFYGAQMNRTVVEFSRSRPQHGWFVPSEFGHDNAFSAIFARRSFGAAFETWYWEQCPVVMVEPTCHEDGPCAPPPGGTGAL